MKNEWEVISEDGDVVERRGRATGEVMLFDALSGTRTRLLSMRLM